MKPESNTTLQDWLDIVWQSALNAQGKGLDVRFVDMGESVGIRIFGVVVRDGRPYLNTTTALPPQGVNGNADGGTDATVVVSEGA